MRVEDTRILCPDALRDPLLHLQDLVPSLDQCRLEARDFRGLGQALIGALFKAVLDRNIPVEFEKRARRLIKENGRVIGVIAEDSSGREFRARARRGRPACRWCFA